MTYRNEAARKDFGDNALMVFRFVVSCCAADAQPLAVVVQKKGGPSDLPDNSWVKVEGRYTLQNVKDGKVPVIEEAILWNTPEPSPPYLY